MTQTDNTLADELERAAAYDTSKIYRALSANMRKGGFEQLILTNDHVGGYEVRALRTALQPRTDAREQALREAEKRIWRVMRRLMTSSCGCDGAYDDGCPECTFEKAQEAAAAIRQQAPGDGA